MLKRRSMFRGLVVPSACAAALMCPLLARAESTLHRVTGTVVVGNTCPGPQRPGQVCSAPLAGTEVRLIDAQDRVAARAGTDAEGQFVLTAPAGSYRLQAGGPGKLPHCPALPVVLPRDADRPLQLACDSGLR